jgi:hypothetical protein
MSEIDLSKQAGAEPVPQESTEAATETEATPQNETDSQALVKHESSGVPAQNSLVLGDTVPEMKDIIIPRLNIVQGVGQLKDQFPQGAIVHGQSTVLFEPSVIDSKTGQLTKKGTNPLVLTVLGFRPTRFAEKVAGGARGLVVATEEEVTKSGGTLSYQEWELKKAAGCKLFTPLAEALVAIERPEHIKDDDTIFTFPCVDKKYAVALWAMKGTAYTNGAKKVFFTQRKMGCLLQGYPTFAFAVTTKLEKYPGGNSAWIPVPVPLERNKPEFIEFAKAILEAPTKDADDQGDE